jgi:V/A-type H+-transporting ATPase subunit I
VRIDLKKFLFVGTSSAKSHFLKEAQKLGIIEFIQEKKADVISSKTKRLIDAIKTLHHFPPQNLMTDVPIEKGDSIVNDIHNTYQTFTDLQKSRSELEIQKRELAPFGHFDHDKLERIQQKSGLIFQFFALSISAKPPPELILVARGEELDSYVWIGQKPLHLPDAVEISTLKSIDQIHQEIKANDEERIRCEKHLEKLTSYRDFLLDLLIESLNLDSYSKALVAGSPAAEGKAFSVIGWVPHNKIEELAKLAQASNIFSEEVAIKKGETPPTYLENKNWSKVGEDLVDIYDTPSSADKDPSMWVLAFFALFFSMIISDAGYGLIFLVIALFIRWKKPNLQGMKKRVLNLFTLLSVGCILWGTLVNGYFGIPIHIDHPLRQVSLIHYLAEKKADYHLKHKDTVYKELEQKYPQIKDATTGREMIESAKSNLKFPILDSFADSILLELALFVGVIHLLLSMSRYALRNWALIGWVIFLAGGYLYVPYKFDYTSILYFWFGWDKEITGILGKEMMIVGSILVLMLAIIQHGLKGLLELMTVIQILADTLSYLRLYALALAGGILSVTIYEMAQKLPIFISVFVILIGHLVNMGLGIMGGVIHGLRLNFLEWYHYSFEGGGKPFRPLKELKKER